MCWLVYHMRRSIQMFHLILWYVVKLFGDREDECLLVTVFHSDHNRQVPLLFQVVLCCLS